MLRKRTRVETCRAFSTSGITLYPDRTHPFDPATGDIAWSLAVAHEDDRARELTRIPMAALRVAVMEERECSMTNGDLLDLVAEEWPDYILADAAILPCVLGEGSRERHDMLHAMREKSLSRLLMSTIIVRPDKPDDEYLLSLRWKGERPGIRRAYSPVNGFADFKNGILLIAPEYKP